MADAEQVRRQRLAALEKAQERRTRRSELRERCRVKDVDALKLVSGDLPEWEDDIEGWRLEQLLVVVPGIGSVTAQEIFEVAKFSPRQVVRSLSKTRREVLARLCEQGQRGPGFSKR